MVIHTWNDSFENVHKHACFYKSHWDIRLDGWINFPFAHSFRWNMKIKVWWHKCFSLSTNGKSVRQQRIGKKCVAEEKNGRMPHKENLKHQTEDSWDCLERPHFNMMQTVFKCSGAAFVFFVSISLFLISNDYLPLECKKTAAYFMKLSHTLFSVVLAFCRAWWCVAAL